MSFFDRLLKNRRLLVFASAFFIMLVTLLPMMIYNGGLFTYYGDYNSQEIPFYYHVNEQLRSGNIFGFDWGTDIGSDLFTSYSFYNTGSVFFYLTLLLPQSLVVYTMPVLMALKTAVAALAAFVFAKRFLKTDAAAFMAAMLYAFSGAMCYNFFFYHFQDAAAFFPLLLLALEQYVNDSRKGTLALTVALCAVTNYYFFITEGIFFSVYLLVRIIYRKNGFNITWRNFFGIVLECVLGILIAAVVLIPSALSILGNPRLGTDLSGLDILVYNDNYRFLRIIQSFFMMPDPPARSNLFSTDSANWASVAGYLPAFSMAGIIAYWRCKKKSFFKTLSIVLFMAALVPVLNSAFQLFNTTYYARWFYAFDLILAVMTAYCFDRPDEVDIKKGFVPTIVGVGIFLVIYMLPVKEDGEYTFSGLAEYDALFVLQAALTAALLVAVVAFVCFVPRNERFRRRAAALTAVCCAVFLAANIYYGISQGPYPETYRENTVDADISLPESDDFYRIETSENTDNYPMLWGYSTIRCFNSTVSSSIMEFYESLGITRDVASRPETEYVPLRSLLSVKYYLDKIDDDDTNDFNENGFTKIDTQGNFNVFENENYLPMGLLFTDYLTEEEFDSYSTYQKCELLMYALVLDDDAIDTYGDTLEELKMTKAITNTFSIVEAADERRAQSCTDFEYSPYGFSAKINADEAGLLMFSVPYDKGFTATVNGESAETVKVDNGLLAVYVEKGESTVEFSYLTYGLKPGLALTAVGAAGFAAYVGITAYIKKKRSADYAQ